MSPRRAASTAARAVAGFPHGRVPHAVRKQQLLAAAERLFLERGFAEASMDELARRMGVSKPVIYDLVSSKERLFAELVESEAHALSAEIERAVEAEPDPEQRLHAGALAFFRCAERRRAAWDVLLNAEAAPVSAELSAVRRFHAKAVAGLLARGAAERRQPVDPLWLDACAQGINGAFEALAAWWKEHPELPAEQLAELATALVARGLTGMFEHAVATRALPRRPRRARRAPRATR